MGSSCKCAGIDYRSEAPIVSEKTCLSILNRPVVKWIERLLLKQLTRVRFPVGLNYRLTFSNKKENTKLLPRVVDRGVGGSFTQGPQDSFAVFWPMNLVNKMLLQLNNNGVS